MGIRVILRGAVAGLAAGVLGFVFSLLFAEPVIEKAIDYEESRDRVLDALQAAAGTGVSSDEPELVSRAMQSTAGLATGVIGMGVVLGVLIAVGYLALHGRYQLRPRTLVWSLAAFGFVGLYLLPFVKYPANPPAIGGEDTITERGWWYLVTVVTSLLLVGIAIAGGRALAARWGMLPGIVTVALAALALYAVVLAVFPSTGDMAAGVVSDPQWGAQMAATETPQPIVNTLDTAVLLDGTSYGPGTIVLPGFDADLLWKFRWYSLINQLLIFGTIALVGGVVIDRGTRRRDLRPGNEPALVSKARARGR